MIFRFTIISFHFFLLLNLQAVDSLSFDTLQLSFGFVAKGDFLRAKFEMCLTHLKGIECGVSAKRPAEKKEIMIIVETKGCFRKVKLWLCRLFHVPPTVNEDINLQKVKKES